MPRLPLTSISSPPRRLFSRTFQAWSASELYNATGDDFFNAEFKAEYGYDYSRIGEITKNVLINLFPWSPILPHMRR